jgi:hypothetical protein
MERYAPSKSRVRTRSSRAPRAFLPFKAQVPELDVFRKQEFYRTPTEADDYRDAPFRPERSSRDELEEENRKKKYQTH